MLPRLGRAAVAAPAAPPDGRTRGRRGLRGLPPDAVHGPGPACRTGGPRSAGTGGSAVSPPPARATHQAVSATPATTTATTTARWAPVSRTRPCTVGGSRSWAQPARRRPTGRCGRRPGPVPPARPGRTRPAAGRGAGQRRAARRTEGLEALGGARRTRPGPGHGGSTGSGRIAASSALSSSSRRRATSATCSWGTCVSACPEPRKPGRRRKPVVAACGQRRGHEPGDGSWPDETAGQAGQRGDDHDRDHARARRGRR